MGIKENSAAENSSKVVYPKLSHDVSTPLV